MIEDRRNVLRQQIVPELFDRLFVDVVDLSGAKLLRLFIGRRSINRLERDACAEGGLRGALAFFGRRGSRLLGFGEVEVGDDYITPSGITKERVFPQPGLSEPSVQRAASR